MVLGLVRWEHVGVRLHGSFAPLSGFPSTMRRSSACGGALRGPSITTRQQVSRSSLNKLQCQSPVEGPITGSQNNPTEISTSCQRPIGGQIRLLDRRKSPKGSWPSTGSTVQISANYNVSCLGPSRLQCQQPWSEQTTL